MLLEKVTVGKTKAPRRIMIYGVQGIGKSTFASQAPSPIFIQTEDGLGNIECAKFPLAQNFEEVMVAINELYQTKHDYKTVVVDSLDWLERMIWKVVVDSYSKKVESIEEIGYAKGYVFALTHWHRFLGGLYNLRNKGMTVILLAHSKIEKFEDPEREAYDRYAPRLHGKAGALVQEWSDEVLFACYKVYIKTQEEGFSKRVQGVSSGERVLKTSERPSHAAKNRLGLPDELPLNWGALAKLMEKEK